MARVLGNLSSQPPGHRCHCFLFLNGSKSFSVRPINRRAVRSQQVDASSSTASHTRKPHCGRVDCPAAAKEFEIHSTKIQKHHSPLRATGQQPGPGKPKETRVRLEIFRPPALSAALPSWPGHFPLSTPFPTRRYNQTCIVLIVCDSTTLTGLLQTLGGPCTRSPPKHQTFWVCNG